MDSQFNAVPVEIIHHILRFADPLSLLRLQMVSKKLHIIINDPQVWKIAYEIAPFARLPGPFPWQSTRLLQRNLVRAAQLEETWTSQPMKVRSGRVVNCPCSSQWIDRRWAIFRKRKKIMLYDLDTDVMQVVRNSRRLSEWGAAWTLSTQGRFLYLILNKRNSDKVKLHVFRLDDESGHLSKPPYIVDVPGLDAINYHHCASGMSNAPFMHIATKHFQDGLIFDSRSRIFYKFPTFRSPLLEATLYDTTVLFTATHILVDYSSPFDTYDIHDEYLLPALLQAFVVPESSNPDSNGVYELVLTHETPFHNPVSSGSLLQNSVVDDITRSTTIRFRKGHHCTKVTLPRRAHNAVLPISIQRHDMFSAIQLKSPNDGGFNTCDNGFVRGLYVEDRPRRGMDKCQRICRKFTIDASSRDDHFEGALGDTFMAPRAVRRGDYWMTFRWFDGFRGRMAYTLEGEDGIYTYVIDFD